jgi:poly(3-hydroxybutyrate) depolymerase
LLYEAYEMQRSMLAGASAWAGIGSEWMSHPANPLALTGFGNMMASGLDVFAHAAAPHGKPEFNLPVTTIAGKQVAVVEEIEATKPFGQLIHFTRPDAPAGQPKLLIVAPMSGHYATLLRGTVERMLPGHDVYITDWRDAKLVPLAAGKLRSRRLCRLRHRLPRAYRRRRTCAGGLPAGGAGLMPPPA